MANLLKALSNIAENPTTHITNFIYPSNRINSIGAAFELYVKDLFCKTLEVDNYNDKYQAHQQAFSYMGAQNQPPDFMIVGGDAVEVKKTKSFKSNIALNSSYPKAKLYRDSQYINKNCRECEDWDVKDHLYVLGVIQEKILKRIWFIYGDCFAANRDIYRNIYNTLSDRIESIPNFEFSNTKELARINNVDPLRITNLRVRGMWEFQNPTYIFDYIFPRIPKDHLQVIAIMRKNKYLSFPIQDRNKVEELLANNFIKSTKEIRNPNNPAQNLDSVVFHYSNEK